MALFDVCTIFRISKADLTLTLGSQVIRNRNLELVEFLIAHSADVNQEALAGGLRFRAHHRTFGNPLGSIPLDFAARKCPPVFLQLLIDHGAS